MVTMVERMAKVETKLESIESKLDAFISSADKRYAGKWTEKIQVTVMVAFIGAVVTKIVGLW